MKYGEITMHNQGWTDFKAACDEVIALAGPLSDADRQMMRDALEEEAARMIAERDEKQGRIF